VELTEIGVCVAVIAYPLAL